MKPGITGLWQISPARAMPIHENMEFDLFYIEHSILLSGLFHSVAHDHGRGPGNWGRVGVALNLAFRTRESRSFSCTNNLSSNS